MPEPTTPNVYEMMFEQTPAVLRWVLTILTCGIFGLASLLYKWHREDMRQMHQRMDKLEDHLIEIAQNTRK